jgi:hypothetical protein
MDLVTQYCHVYGGTRDHNDGDLFRMIGFISTSIKSSLNHTQLQRYRYSTHFQFTIAHALEFSVFTSHLLGMFYVKF